MWCDLNFETSAPSQTWFVPRESFDVNDGEDGDILHVPGAQTEHQNDHGNSNIVSNPDPYTCEEHVIQTAKHNRSNYQKMNDANHTVARGWFDQIELITRTMLIDLYQLS